MTEGYITVRDIVNLSKNYAKECKGFTKSVTECQTEDATLEDGRYVVSISKIADIRCGDEKQIILWHKPDYAELFNVYVGGWFNEAENIYEIEEVLIFYGIDHAIEMANQKNQKYIYDLKEKKCINVDTYYLTKRLETELVTIDKNLEELKWLWSMEVDSEKAYTLYKSWDYVMLTRKQIARRIVLLNRYSDL